MQCSKCTCATDTSQTFEIVIYFDKYSIEFLICIVKKYPKLELARTNMTYPVVYEWFLLFCCGKKSAEYFSH